MKCELTDVTEQSPSSEDKISSASREFSRIQSPPVPCYLVPVRPK
jgi:hypothetical protein